ncbi:probable WRKY transcription factor protein 1 [Daktulosphaira vitifoliae]|uniref:probable WRKY transcription factor protein 1 n=1 Tax=Daktulosphaira vitifoliae TaxID=58002 RepID=UPI0021AA5157|nr:probable WRKY transcription factor protein 1 [Daktulosphaira vitifoliae]
MDTETIKDTTHSDTTGKDEPLLSDNTIIAEKVDKSLKSESTDDQICSNAVENPTKIESKAAIQTEVEKSTNVSFESIDTTKLENSSYNININNNSNTNNDDICESISSTTNSLNDVVSSNIDNKSAVINNSEKLVNSNCDTIIKESLDILEEEKNIEIEVAQKVEEEKNQSVAEDKSLGITNGLETKEVDSPLNDSFVTSVQELSISVSNDEQIEEIITKSVDQQKEIASDTEIKNLNDEEDDRISASGFVDVRDYVEEECIDEQDCEDECEYEEESIQTKDQEQSTVPVSVDDDTNDPQYIPRRGRFYEHDDRMAYSTSGSEAEDEENDIFEGEESTSKSFQDGEVVKKKKILAISKVATTTQGTLSTISSQKDSAGTPDGKPLRKSRPDAVDKWVHDKYDEHQQSPKSTAELVRAYGYNIRVESEPPKARRHHKYGRGANNKYTRNWQDTKAYEKESGPGGVKSGLNKKFSKKKPFAPDAQNDYGKEFPDALNKSENNAGTENENFISTNPHHEKQLKQTISSAEPTSSKTNTNPPVEKKFDKSESLNKTLIQTSKNEQKQSQSYNRNSSYNKNYDNKGKQFDSGPPSGNRRWKHNSEDGSKNNFEGFNRKGKYEEFNNFEGGRRNPKFNIDYESNNSTDSGRRNNYVNKDSGQSNSNYFNRKGDSYQKRYSPGGPSHYQNMNTSDYRGHSSSSGPHVNKSRSFHNQMNNAQNQLNKERYFSRPIPNEDEQAYNDDIGDPESMQTPVQSHRYSQQHHRNTSNVGGVKKSSLQYDQEKQQSMAPPPATEQQVVRSSKRYTAQSRRTLPDPVLNFSGNKQNIPQTQSQPQPIPQQIQQSSLQQIQQQQQQIQQNTYQQQHLQQQQQYNNMIVEQQHHLNNGMMMVDHTHHPHHPHQHHHIAYHQPHSHHMTQQQQQQAMHGYAPSPMSAGGAGTSDEQQPVAAAAAAAAAALQMLSYGNPAAQAAAYQPQLINYQTTAAAATQPPPSAYMTDANYMAMIASGHPAAAATAATTYYQQQPQPQPHPPRRVNLAIPIVAPPPANGQQQPNSSDNGPTSSTGTSATVATS